ncbi:hypothetical protein M405DRAFT_861089 [Rhizopogon salebrosus TDB-379]|nr:hypothetical protein M405DRAFT_861089 [Rhizopogon salebrosus TDB-379]
MSFLMQDILPQTLDLGNTFGALVIGVILAAVSVNPPLATQSKLTALSSSQPISRSSLFGATNVQALIYFQTHTGGTGMTFYKLVVIWLWILDAFHKALITHCVYHYIVISYTNSSALAEVVWSFKVFIVYAVHVLYGYRIWIVSKGRSRALPVTVGLILILVSGVAIVLIWATYQRYVFTDLIGVEWATYMASGMITFVDFVMASSLCCLLTTSHTGFSSTDSFLTKLMAYTINTGCLTSSNYYSETPTVSLSNSSQAEGNQQCAVMPENFIFVGIQFMASSLYVNSYFALLNARYYLQAKEPEINDISDFRAHRPSLHSWQSEAENLQESGKDVLKHLRHSSVTSP